MILDDEVRGMVPDPGAREVQGGARGGARGDAREA